MQLPDRINNVCITRNEVLRRSKRDSLSVSMHIQFRVRKYSQRDISVRLPKDHKWDFTKAQMMDYYTDKVHTMTGGVEYVDTEAFPMEDWNRVWAIYESLKG